MRLGMRAAWLVLGLLLPVFGAAATAAPIAPQLTVYATDQTGTLSASELASLNARLAALDKTKGAQLVVLLVATTQPEDIAAYSLAVAERNRIGRKGSDDGVLLLIAKADRRARIEVGYGLEGAIPDVTASRIIREYLAPKFRHDDYAGGINDAVTELTRLIDGEALPPPLDPGARAKAQPNWILVAIIALYLAALVRGILSRAKLAVRVPLGAILTGGALLLLLGWMLPAVIGAVVGGLFMLLPGSSGRYIGGGSWGGGGFGSGGLGSGGGFSGGGGGFGGGGASGGW